MLKSWNFNLSGYFFSHFNFVFILIKSPLQLKLMTGAHQVTVAPLVVGVMPLLELTGNTVFRTFLLHALTYLAIILHMTLFRQFASIFVGVIPLWGLGILEIHSFLLFPPSCIDKFC